MYLESLNRPSGIEEVNCRVLISMYSIELQLHINIIYLFWWITFQWVIIYINNN
jgi:hypothetical protein